MQHNEQEEPRRIYIPSFLNAIGYSDIEGGPWKEWNKDWGQVPSHSMFRGINQQIGKVRFSIDFIVLTQHRLYGETVYHEEQRIHAILFEKGYMWDCVNGWRSTKLEETTLDQIKSSWFFSK